MGYMELFWETTRECWATIHSGGWPELGWWSYLLLALLVATEGPVSTLIGAAAAATGILDIRYVFASAFFGNVVGDCLWYSVGYVSDLKRIHRFGSWFGLRHHHVDRLEHEMHRHATKLIALSKLAIGLIVPTLVAAGLARVPWRRWFPLVLSIEVLWTLLMVNLGYHGAGLVTQLERGLQLVGVVALAAIVGGAIWYGRRFFAHSEAAMGEEIGAEGETEWDEAWPQTPTTTLLRTAMGEHREPWHLDLGVSSTLKFPLHALPRNLVSRTIHTSRRTSYKQMARRFAGARLAVSPLTRQSLAARSAMTRALAEGKNLIRCLATSRPNTYVQEVHFAGD